MERAATNSGLERRVESVVQTEVAQMKQMSAARQPVEFADAEVEAQVSGEATRLFTSVFVRVKLIHS